LWQTSGLEKGQAAGHIRGMQTRLPILLSVALLAAAILLVFREELHAHSEPVTQCGFWGSMEAGNVLPMTPYAGKNDATGINPDLPFMRPSVRGDHAN
jgi:hypothetical protein